MKAKGVKIFFVFSFVFSVLAANCSESNLIINHKGDGEEAEFEAAENNDGEDDAVIADADAQAYIEEKEEPADTPNCAFTRRRFS